jgi:hypothetical protein
MAVCPHPVEFLHDSRERLDALGGYENVVECGICLDVIDVTFEPDPDYEFPIPVEAHRR